MKPLPVLAFIYQPAKESLLDSPPADIRQLHEDRVVIVGPNPRCPWGQSVYWNLTPGKCAPDRKPSIVGNLYLTQPTSMLSSQPPGASDLSMSASAKDSANAKDKVLETARQMVRDGLYPSLMAVTDRSGIGYNTVDRWRKRLVASGEWPCDVAASGGNVTVMLPNGQIGKPA